MLTANVSPKRLLFMTGDIDANATTKPLILPAKNRRPFPCEDAGHVHPNAGKVHGKRGETIFSVRCAP